MQFFKSTSVLLLLSFVLIRCSQPPEKYFDVAVLNSNFVAGFADKRLAYELSSPSVKLDEKTGGTVAMKRKEIIDSKIDFTEKSLDKLNELSETEDAKAILQSSRAMYEYILPVYKQDYQQLAALYDENAGEERINAALQAIHDKHFPKFDELYSKLITDGKAYAAKHNITVNWAD